MKHRQRVEEWITEIIGIQYDYADPNYPDEISYATEDFEHKIASILKDVSDNELIDMFCQHSNGYPFEELMTDIEYEAMHEMTTCVVTRADRIRLSDVDTHCSMTENLCTVLDLYERSLMTPAQIDAASPSEVFEAEHVIERALEVLHDTVQKEGE